MYRLKERKQININEACLKFFFLPDRRDSLTFLFVIQPRYIKLFQLQLKPSVAIALTHSQGQINIA